MGIDWEELLGAEGDDLQDAYDDAVEAESYYEDEYEGEYQSRDSFFKQRELTAYCRKPETQAKQEAVRKWLNQQFPINLRWHIVVKDDGKPDPNGLWFLGDFEPDQLDQYVAEEPGGRIALLSPRSSRIFGSRGGFSDCRIGEMPHYCSAEFIYGLSTNHVEYQHGRYVLKPPYRHLDKYRSYLKSEYDPWGMPRKIVNTAKNDAVWWSRGKNYVWFEGTKYPNEEITWIFQLVSKEDGSLTIIPVEAWVYEKLIWLRLD